MLLHPIGSFIQLIAVSWFCDTKMMRGTGDLLKYSLHLIHIHAHTLASALQTLNFIFTDKISLCPLMSNQNDKWQMTRHDKATWALIKKKKNLISQLEGSCGKRYRKIWWGFWELTTLRFFPRHRQIFCAKHFSAFRYPFDVFFLLGDLLCSYFSEKVFQKYFCARALEFLSCFFTEGY